MSVLIKGMDMPDSCRHCCMMTGAFCDILNIDVDPYYDGAKHRNVCCPLVELPETCDTCKHNQDVYDSGFCDGCTQANSNWEFDVGGRRMSELKPCPFCGGEAELDFAHTSFTYTDVFGKTRETGFFYTVKCRDNSCGCKIGVYEEPRMAIEAWNRRACDE